MNLQVGGNFKRNNKFLFLVHLFMERIATKQVYYFNIIYSYICLCLYLETRFVGFSIFNYKVIVLVVAGSEEDVFFLLKD